MNKEAKTTIDEFLKYVDKEIRQWVIYKKSPELQERVKNNIIAGLLKLPELQKTATIDKLIESKVFTISEMNQALEIPVEDRELVNAKELIETDLKPTEMLVGGGLIPKVEGYSLIGGLAKEGKTLLSLQLGLNLISGTNFLDDFRVDRKCKILYIYRENTKPGLKAIIEKQITGLGKIGTKIDKKDLENFYTYYGKNITLNLKNPIIGNLKKDIKAIEPDVVFLDPIGQFIGFDINKAENIKRFRDLLMEINPSFWVLIHHYTKPRFLSKGESDIAPIYRLLGSSYLANTCESFIGLEPEGDRYSDTYKKIYFTTRSEKEPIPLHLKRDSTFLVYDVLDSVSLLTGRVTKDDIIRILTRSFKGKASYKDLVTLCSDQFGVKEKRIANLIKEIREAGIIAKEEGKRGKWYITKLFSEHL